MFRFLKCCCINCPPCPPPFEKYKGYTDRIINGCPRCPVECIPCIEFPNQRGYEDTFISNCPKCPKCGTVNPCYRSSLFFEKCKPCVPKKFLFVVMDGSINCPCFSAVCPVDTPEPHDHAESTGDVSGAYCFGEGMPTEYRVPVSVRHWDGSGGGLVCGPPNALRSESIEAVITGGGGPTAFGMDFLVDIQTSDSKIFHGQIVKGPCTGPWVISNQITGGCKIICPPDVLTEQIQTPCIGPVIVYACGC